LFCFAVFAAFAFIVVTGCGKKGPPLAPLVKLPTPPADLVAERRGDTVDLQFTVPSTNTDGTRPANVAHADVYAITAPPNATPLTDADLLKFGTKVGSVEVKAPRDPNLTAEPDEPAEEIEEPEGPGLNQGAVARLAEPLTEDMLTPVELPKDKKQKATSVDEPEGPLVGPPPNRLARTYAVFGTSTRGRKGPFSKRIVVPLVPPPPPPEAPTMTYNERTVSLKWPPAGASEPADSKLLPSRPIGVTRPTMGYNVYDATDPDAVVKLTKTPVDEPRFSDPRITWGEKRCYIVATAETIGTTTIESEPAPAECQTLTDTFPPGAPKDVKGIASEGAINLIWEPNTEKDLAGYIVLRGIDPGETLEPITPAPIQEPSFKDAVQPGVAYAYAVKAVDKAGNASPASARVVETAR
jgi:hypothetical protein